MYIIYVLFICKICIYLALFFISFILYIIPKELKETSLNDKKTLLLGGGGPKFWFYAGIVYQRCQNNPSYIDDFDTIVSCSCGSVLAPFFICKMDFLQIKKELIDITNKMMNTKTEETDTYKQDTYKQDTYKQDTEETKDKCRYTICNCLDIVREYLLNTLPENAHILCSNKLHIQTIYLPHCKSHCFNLFSSKEELVDKIIKSCHIPIITGSITNEGYIDRLGDYCCSCEAVEGTHVSRIFNLYTYKTLFELKNIFVIPDETYIETNFTRGRLNYTN